MKNNFTHYKTYHIIILIFTILLSFVSCKNDFQIYDLVEIGDNIYTKFAVNETYYFFSSISNVKVNEYISYYISKPIQECNISYTFLDSNDSSSIKEEDIENYSFNQIFLDGLNYDKYFKSIIKTEESQKGLLLSMIINDFSETEISTTIQRINLTIVNQGNTTLYFNTQYNYLFLNFTQYIFNNDIFIISSKCDKRLLYYYSISSQNLYKNNNYAKFIYFTNEEQTKILKYIEIDSDKEEEFYITINVFETKRFFLFDELTLGNSVNRYAIPIELSTNNYNYEDVYIITTPSFKVFYKQILGEVDAYYLSLKNYSKIDDIFTHEIERMNKFDADNIIDSFNINLIYFKTLNHKPAFLEFYFVDYTSNYGMVEGDTRVDVYYESSMWNHRLYFFSSYDNISITFELLVCKLDDNENINIDLGDNQIELNKFNQTITLENINIVSGEYPVTSKKECALKIQLGENKNSTAYTLEENIENNIVPYKRIYFEYPKIDEDNHYFVDIKPDMTCSVFYEDKSNKIHKFNPYFIKSSFLSLDNQIRYNPYKIFENEYNLTYWMNCYFDKDAQHSDEYPFSIKKIAKIDAVYRKIILPNNYTEYIFPQISSDGYIIIQNSKLFENNKYYDKPLLTIGNFEKYIMLKNYIFSVHKGDIQKILIKSENTCFLSMNFINKANINDFYNDLYNMIDKKKYYNATLGYKGVYTVSIEPLILNKNIKYIIYSSIDNININNNVDKIFENFGGILDNKTFEKESNDIIKYELDLGKLNVNTIYLLVVGIDIDLGYNYNYDIKSFDYKYEINEEEEKNQEQPQDKDNDNNKIKTWVIILIVILIILIIGVVIFIIIRKIKKKNTSSLDIEGSLVDK